jgi:hypothetical protein
METAAPGAAQPNRRRQLLVNAAVLLVMLAGIAWIQHPDGRLHIFVPALAGDAILIQAPDGRFTLIDGGAEPAMTTLCLGRHMPFWQRELHAVLLTSTGHQHLPGQVAALTRYRAGMALAMPEQSDSALWAEWQRLNQQAGTPRIRLAPAQRLSLGGGSYLTPLAVAPGAEGGAVLLIEYGTVRILIHTGGPHGDAAAARLAGVPITMLIYPWQREPFAAGHLTPAATIFSDGYEAEEPALRTYRERRSLSPAIYHEANDGDIELISDGRRFWITTTEE